MMSPSNLFFVTGTDTEIGKTQSTSMLLKSFARQGFAVAGLKPIASGFERKGDAWINDDIETLKASSNVELPNHLVNVYSFRQPIAPHIGAADEEISICLDKIANTAFEASEKVDLVFVEGVGGWRVPLSAENEGESDPVLARGDVSSLAKKLGAPVILVVGMRLGCISHALLTAEQILADGLNLVGWVANSATPTMDRYEENLATLSRQIKAPLLFEMPYLPDEHAREEFRLDLCPELLGIEAIVPVLQT